MANRYRLKAYKLQIDAKENEEDHRYSLTPKLSEAPFNLVENLADRQLDGLTVVAKRLLTFMGEQFLTDVSEGTIAVHIPKAGLKTDYKGRILNFNLNVGRRGDTDTFIDNFSKPTEGSRRLGEDSVVRRSNAACSLWLPADQQFAILVVAARTDYLPDALVQLTVASAIKGDTVKISRVTSSPAVPKDVLDKLIKSAEIGKIIIEKRHVSQDSVNDTLGVGFAKSDATIRLQIDNVITDLETLKSFIATTRSKITGKTKKGSLEHRFFVSEQLKNIGLGESPGVHEKFFMQGEDTSLSGTLKKILAGAPARYLHENDLGAAKDSNLADPISLLKHSVLYLQDVKASLL